MNMIKFVFLQHNNAKVHMFTLPLFHFCSYPFMICNIRMMSVWRMLQNARHSSHITPSPGQTDRQLSVSGHALMCCVSVWPHEAPLSQSEARMGTHWPIRGQDWADHDTDAVMSGVMRGEAVTRSKCQDRNTNTPLNCPSGQLSDEENWCDAEGGPNLSTPGETSNWAWNLFRLFKIVLAGLHTHPTLIGITFCTFRTFCKIGSQWKRVQEAEKNILSL